MSAMEKISWNEGGVYGAATYVGSLALSMTTFYLDSLSTPLWWDSALSEKLVLAVTLFYNSHFVTSELGGGEPGWEPETTPLCFSLRCLEFFSTGTGIPHFLFSPVYYVIPPLFLLGTGALLVYATEPSGRLGSLVAGASVAVGYLPIMLLVVVVLRLGAGFTLELPTTITFGILYPVVFGGVGGLMSNEVISYRTRSVE